MNIQPQKKFFVKVLQLSHKKTTDGGVFDWKQTVSSATVSGREICKNHFFKNQIFHAQKQREYLFFDKLWDICE